MASDAPTLASHLAATDTPPDSPLLDGLNPEQRTAVETTQGPVLVLAGAGTGKTRVLTTRLAHLMAVEKVWPSRLLAVTFTNRAAREMQHRIAGLIGERVEGMQWLGTFHSIGARILRRHAELADLRHDFTILDADDQVRLLKQLVRAANIDEKRWPARTLAAYIDNWKNRGLTPKNVPAEESDLYAGRGSPLYAAYQQRLKTLNAADFGDLLLECLTVFLRDESVLADYQERFRHILVDEYQDTNIAQYQWLRLLAQKHRNICCVGDDDQSIYGWRGAEVGNILRFETDFPGAAIIRLERNYRSTPHILGAASGLIAANASRLGKTLWSENPDGGEKVLVRGAWNDEAETRMVSDAIEFLQERGESLNETAILVRTAFQLRIFEERFIAIALPYRVVGGPRFYERAEIRDANAYLRLVAQPDDDLAFERIVNRPRRGIGERTIQTLHEAARSQGVSLMRAARAAVERGDLRGKAQQTLAGFIAMTDRWRDQAKTTALPDLAGIILDESGYTAMWQAEKSADAPGRLENLKELVGSMADFESLTAYLEHIALVMEMTSAESGDRVTLMTLHSAKGLEFDTVFLPGWEEGLFPHQRSLDEKGGEGLEEERRLAYVGLTRARKRAMISFAGSRMYHGRWLHGVPSRFLDELPPDHIDRPEAVASGGLRRRVKRLKSPASETDGPQISVGTRVFHQKFGYGKVAAVEEEKLTINFEKAGRKKILGSFVERVP